MTPLAHKALEIAQGQVGIVEQTRNRSERIDDYVRSVGLRPEGQHPWCMAFVYWCFAKASEATGFDSPVPKTGGVRRAWRETLREFKIKVPHVGCVFFHRSGERTGHTGIVSSVNLDTGKMCTVEGNTNAAGSREGDRVQRKVRAIAYANLGFAEFGKISCDRSA